MLGQPGRLRRQTNQLVGRRPWTDGRTDERTDMATAAKWLSDMPVQVSAPFPSAAAAAAALSLCRARARSLVALASSSGGGAGVVWCAHLLR